MGFKRSRVQISLPRPLKKEITVESEKRKAPRIEKVLTVRYSSIRQEVDSWDSSTLKNISTTGIMLYTNKMLARGELVKLLIKIPFDPQHWLETNGQVIESSTNITHIRFS